MAANKQDAYYSNARWSRIPDTKDCHNHSNHPEINKEFAFSVCFGLMGDYKNKECSVRGKCLGVWVTDHKGNKVEL